MFAKACAIVRPAVYAIFAISRTAPDSLIFCTGTGFMIAPGILATAAHITHQRKDPSLPIHQLFSVISAPEIGQPFETATFITDDLTKDIALLRIQQPRHKNCVTLETKLHPPGTSCGSLGFPLSTIHPKGNQLSFHYTERFQGAFISSLTDHPHPGAVRVLMYELDSLMYDGASGCPAFLANGQVIGLYSRSLIKLPPAEPATDPVYSRFSISLWALSTDIAAFAKANGVLQS